MNGARDVKLVLVISLALGGCAKPNQPNPTTNPAVVAPSTTIQPVAPTIPVVPGIPQPVAVQVDPKIAAFKARMAAFVEEALSLARYCEQVPDAGRYARKHEIVEDLFTRIPDPPPGFQQMYADAKQVRVDLGVGTLFAQQLAESFRLGAKDLVDQGIALERDLAAKQKTKLAAIEAALRTE